MKLARERGGYCSGETLQFPDMPVKGSLLLGGLNNCSLSSQMKTPL